MLRSHHIFDLAALPYELLTHSSVWESHCAAMAAELPPGARLVLDLGCGPGNSTEHLRRAVGAGAVGADFSRPMLRRASRREPRLALLCADAGALPLRSGSLDAVTFHSVLYLLPDRARALGEVARCLRPGGRAVLLEPQAGVLSILRGLVRALPTPLWAFTASAWRTMSTAYGAFTRASLGAHLEACGLRVLRIDEALGGLGLLAAAEKPR